MPRVALSALSAVFLVACSGGEPEDTDPVDQLTPVCTEQEPVACFDDLLIDLSLQTDVSNGAVSSDPDGNDWVSDVDASAGGVTEAPSNPWVYVKFTDAGLERVDIDDESALESMEWHLAARRFVLRLNGGSSGPSCVAAAALPGADYDTVTLDDMEGANFFEDDYYSASCDLINDSSGLPGSPQVALGPWWSYPNCVATTGVPFLIQLDTGRVLKFTVPRYYGTQQAGCNNNSTPGGDSANYRFRWSFLN